MRRLAIVFVALVAPWTATGCVDNTSPGNDREAHLDPPAPPADVASAASALAGVATHLVKPEILSDADVANAPAADDACRFRMTEVGFPVLVYGSTAVVKLNGKLVPLPAAGEGRYADAGVEVGVRRLDGGQGEGTFAAEMVLRLPGAPDELGFHGYATCGSA